MKLEKGMYVRTKIGIIGKIVSINKDSDDNNIITIFNGHLHIIHNEIRTELDIVKGSHNIIDLIEVGDYVNGLKVDVIENSQLFNFNSYDGWKVNITPYDNETISIVTKEQFESMAYKVGE